MGYDYATPQEVASLHSQIDSMRQDIIRQQAEIERLKAENQRLRERQEARSYPATVTCYDKTLELRNLPKWKPSITPEALK